MNLCLKLILVGLKILNCNGEGLFAFTTPIIFPELNLNVMIINELAFA
jgi:hypothetical protein